MQPQQMQAQSMQTTAPGGMVQNGDMLTGHPQFYENPTPPPATESAPMAPPPPNDPQNYNTPVNPQNPGIQAGFEAKNFENNKEVIDYEATRKAMEAWADPLDIEELKIAKASIDDAIAKKSNQAFIAVPEPQAQPTMQQPPTQPQPGPEAYQQQM